MSEKDPLWFNRSINIFTDASLTHYQDHTITCGGYIVVKDRMIIDSNYSIINNSTSNYGELYAVLLGIQAAIKYKNQFMPINLFSDSKISVETLRNWIFSWSMRDNVLYNSSGKPAENQDIIAFIVNVVTMNQIPITLYMQRGHKNPNKSDDVKVQKNYFRFANGFEIDKETAKKLCYYNDFIDNLTRSNLISVIRDSTFMDSKYNKKTIPFYINLDEETMNIYSGLIRPGYFRTKKRISYFE